MNVPQPIVSFSGTPWQPMPGNSQIAPPFALSGTRAIHEMNETGVISARTTGEMKKAAQEMLGGVETAAAYLASAMLHLFSDEDTARASAEHVAATTGSGPRP